MHMQTQILARQTEKIEYNRVLYLKHAKIIIIYSELKGEGAVVREKGVYYCRVLNPCL